MTKIRTSRRRRTPKRSGRLGSVVSAMMIMVLGSAFPFVAGSAAAAPAGAGTPATPALVPTNPGPRGYFEYTLPPGGEADGAVTVRNPSSGSATFALYPTDASTSAATGVAYGGLGDTPHATGSWVHLGTSQVVLAPGQAQTVAFHVSVPAHATPGDHVAAVAAENPAHGQQDANAGHRVGVSLDVNTRVVVAVVVHVPGPAVTAIELGRPALVAENGSQQVVTLPMDDTGGLLAKPLLAASLRRCRGGPVMASQNRQLDTFVPHTKVLYDWALGQLVLGAGCYRVTATLTNAGTLLSTVTGNVVVTAAQAKVKPAGGTPPAPRAHDSRSIWLAVAAAVALIGVGLILALARRSRQARRRLETELARLKAAAASDEHSSRN